jgi:predicted transcriptional regulator
MEPSMRTLIDLAVPQVRALDRLAERKHRSRAALIREAVDAYLARHGGDGDAEAFGAWAGAVGDGLAYEDRVRGEW